MVLLFTCLARRGETAGTLPSLRLLAADSQAQPHVRVLPPDVALLTRHTMKFVVDAVDRNAAKKDMPVGGLATRCSASPAPPKSRSAVHPPARPSPAAGGYFDNQFISSFLSAGPVEDPKLACLVIIDDPGPRDGVSRRSRYGATAAGPAARRIMERSLTYLGVGAPRVPLATN